MITESVSGVYGIMNTVNGKRYIGSSANVGQRFRQHRCALRGERHKNHHLQSSFSKHGEQAFEFNLLIVCTIEDLAFYEQRTVRVFGSIENGYNHRLEVETNRGTRFSAEARRNMSLGQKGKAGTYGMLGKILSEESRHKIGEAHRGMKRSTETRVHMSIAQKKRFAETPMSDEQRIKISESTRERFKDPEERAKISRTLRGRPWSAARRAVHDRKEEE